MNSTEGTRPRKVVRRTAGLISLAVATAGMAAVGAASSPAQAAPVAISNAELRWDINKESTSGAFAPGTWNLFSAGKLSNPGQGAQTLTTADNGATWSNGEAAGWKNSEGNVTVDDLQADGRSYAPTTFAGTRTDHVGAVVNASGRTSQNVVSIEDGTGTVDPAANTASIAWDGDFTVVYYSGMSFFYVSDPVLTVEADGDAELTATLSGYGSEQDDPEVWTELAPTEVTLAVMKGVDVTESGVSATPDYREVRYDVPADGTPQVTSGANWGAFPQSFVDFQARVGTAQYWYSTGGSADARKPATALNVSYRDQPVAAPSVTVSQTELADTGDHAVTVRGEGFDPTAATATRPPLAGKPGGAYVVFGKFAEAWRPSAGAPGANRVNSNQKWAVLADDMPTIGGAEAGAIELRADGSFTATLTINKSAIDAKATASNLVNYGIYTYPGSGAVNAGYETYTPITFKKASSIDVRAPAATYGKSGTVTVNVDRSDDEAATGSVTLKVGSKSLGSKALAAGSARFALPKTLPAGSHRLTATYSGDASLLKSTGATTLKVAKATSRVKATWQKKPTSKKAGKLRVAVTTNPSGKATGKVTVKIRTKSGKVVKTLSGKLVANGVKRWSVPKLKKGTYTYTTAYAGNSNIAGKTGARATVKITK